MCSLHLAHVKTGTELRVGLRQADIIHKTQENSLLIHELEEFDPQPSPKFLLGKLCRHILHR